MIKRTIFAASVAAFLVAPVSADDIFNSNGFEASDYALGPLNAQQNWYGEPGLGGHEPMIVDTAGRTIDAQALMFEVDDVATDYSYAEIAFDDIVFAGYKTVTVSFDVYRENDGWSSNLWWWWFDEGTPTYGLQWDEANGAPGGTYPFGWVDGASGVPTIQDQYTNVEMTWDLENGAAECYYNGEFVCAINILDITALTGWAFQLAHDEADGSGPDTCYVDNFVISGTKDGEFTLGISPDPLVAGSQGKFEVTSGTPDTNTFLAYSTRGAGETYVPFLNVTLDMRGPKQAGGTKKTDANGIATWILPIPGNTAGVTIWLQAVQTENKTNLIKTTIQ